MTDPPTRTAGRQATAQIRRLGVLLVRARLLLSSYVGLDLILVARVHPLWPRVACGVLAAVGILDAAHLCRLARSTRAVPRDVDQVADAGGEITAYLATYLLPLLAAPSPSAGDLVAYGIYGLLIVVVSLQSDLVQVNPTLYLLGRRVSNVTFLDGGTAYVVSSGRVQPQKPIRVTRLAGVLVSQ